MLLEREILVIYFSLSLTEPRGCIFFPRVSQSGVDFEFIEKLCLPSVKSQILTLSLLFSESMGSMSSSRVSQSGVDAEFIEARCFLSFPMRG